METAAGFDLMEDWTFGHDKIFVRFSVKIGWAIYQLISPQGDSIGSLHLGMSRKRREQDVECLSKIQNRLMVVPIFLHVVIRQCQMNVTYPFLSEFIHCSGGSA